MRNDGVLDKGNGRGGDENQLYFEFVFKEDMKRYVDRYDQGFC